MTTVLGAMAPDIERNEVKNNQLADRNSYGSPQTVLEGLS